MADAAQLGIYPPDTVRITMGGWAQDWPWETIEVAGDVVIVNAMGAHIVYPYEHAHEQPDGSWLFAGREDFTVHAGPPQAPAMDTAGPQY